MSSRIEASVIAILLSGPTVVHAEPPVKVEVVVDADEDFFDKQESEDKEEEADENSAANSGDRAVDQKVVVKTHKKKPDGSQNINTQVVNVVVMGEKDTDIGSSAGAGSAAAVSSKKTVPDPSARETPVTESGATPLSSSASAPTAQAKMVNTAPPTPTSWWDRPSYAEEGDLLLWLQGTGNAAGGIAGLGIEGMATDIIGLRLTGIFGEFRGSDLASGFARGNLNFLQGGIWANSRDVKRGEVSSGSVHLIDLAMAFHVFPKESFDLFPSIGLSHFGYAFVREDGIDRGGGGYLRLGLGFNVFFSRFFLGMDFGWYPAQLFRYSLEDSHRYGRHSARAVRVRSNPEPFDHRRATLTAHLGLRF